MTPTPRALAPSVGIHSDSHALLPPLRPVKDGRSPSATSVASRGQSFSAGPPPGSFTPDLKSTAIRTDATRPGLDTYSSFQDETAKITSEQRQASYRDRIEKETKIKIGSENLLEALNSKNVKQTRDQRLRVESELNASNRKIAQLKLDLEAEIQRSKEQAMSPSGRLSQLFRSAPVRSPSHLTLPSEDGLTVLDTESESPTYVLAEILQALEVDDMAADYYVGHANELVELFKRHPTLKYDLAWSIFGIRLQMMLLSDSRELVAAGYRVMRYAITDRKSLQTIRALHTDYLVVLSLVKESKASVEREQALKFVRAFLDVKDGVQEIAPTVLRMITAVAEHGDDRLRSLCTLTIAEVLIRDPPLLVSAGGIGTLTDALGDGTYYAPETLVTAFLHLMDVPDRRCLLRSGHELGVPFASFAEPPTSHAHEEKLKANAKVIAALFKSWSGLMTLSLHNWLAIRSVVSSLYISVPMVRNILLELLFDILRIKPPSWSSSFLAGRRLTTYGRVTSVKNDNPPNPTSAKGDDDSGKMSLVEHFMAIVLAVFLKAGLLTALMHAEQDAPNLSVKRKTTLLVGEVLRMANHLLPQQWSAELQVLPHLFNSASSFGQEDRFEALATIYQVDSVNRTLYRLGSSSTHLTKPGSAGDLGAGYASNSESAKVQFSSQIDEVQFRSLLMECQVLNT
ncbi:hypothetical protein LTR28_005988, partial [Elasticomyces elasticus]